jgi:hypothetical protein
VDCQKQRQHDNVAAWRQLHPEYRVAQAMRLRERLAAKEQMVDPLEMPAPLSGLPWQVAQRVASYGDHIPGARPLPSRLDCTKPLGPCEYAVVAGELHPCESAIIS